MKETYKETKRVEEKVIIKATQFRRKNRNNGEPSFRHVAFLHARKWILGESGNI